MDPKKHRLLNLDRGVLPSADGLGIPLVLREEPVAPAYLLPYRQKVRTEHELPGGCVHFFLEDYRFESCWSKPKISFGYLAKTGRALTPDFSLYPEMPLALQLYQVYRNRWCGAVWQQAGLDVVPTITWSDEESFPFCFLGVQEGATVAVSTVGLRRADGGEDPASPRARELFLMGYEEMVRIIKPGLVLVYGEPGDLVAGLSAEARAVPRKIYPSRWKSIREERKRVEHQEALGVS